MLEQKEIITEKNIREVYGFFLSRVIKSAENMEHRALASLFVRLVSEADDIGFDGKKNCLIQKSPETISVPVDMRAYHLFIAKYQRAYSESELSELLSRMDGLFENKGRRERGQFYTPPHLVDFAHRVIQERLGNDWRERFVVWDNCCGTGNLTRAYEFSKLYLSSNEDAELELVKGQEGAEIFHFDFLNDSIYDGDLLNKINKIPDTLLSAFEANLPIVFFLNPPYAKGAHYGTGAIESSAINAQMRKARLGQSSANLYAQFLYRIQKLKEHFKLTNCYLAFFSPTLIYTGSSFSKFRQHFFQQFSYEKSVIFRASHFSDTAKSWAVAFSILRCGKTETPQTFDSEIVDWSAQGNLSVLGTKQLYNTDNAKAANHWVREPSQGVATFDAPNLTSALKLKESGIRRGKTVEGALGYFYSNSNNVEKNPVNVALFSSPFSAGEGLAITQMNLERCLTLFAARKLISNHWINNKDEYFAPDETHPKWEEFVNDAYVFSLFHSSSNQSSMRNLSYKNMDCEITNGLFFMGKEEILKLSEIHKNTQIINDLKGRSECVFYLRLKQLELSPEARTVLLRARELVEKSFSKRAIMQEKQPELHLNAWDAGWYQIKRVLEAYFPEDLLSFQGLFAQLSQKMRPLVYELGFLK